MYQVPQRRPMEPEKDVVFDSALVHDDVPTFVPGNNLNQPSYLFPSPLLPYPRHRRSLGSYSHSSSSHCRTPEGESLVVPPEPSVLPGLYSNQDENR